ncbi:MAG: ABC transporter permease [Fimbriimonadales bacterium]
MEWLQTNLGNYFSNATARRDFRTQLRGTKPILLWSSYLLLLIMIGMSIYSGLANAPEHSVASQQYALASFFQAIMMLLAAAMTLIAPALTAASIAGERQRRSLDLVLSTPIELKHYLVGKLIASYRYTWMLLLLSLPLVSMCIVLGGATWVDVIYAYIYLSLFGLLFTAVGLTLSVVAPRPISAVVYTYGAIGGYVAMSMAMAGLAYSTGGPGLTNGSFLMALNPFSVGLFAGTSTLALGLALPNWIHLAVFVGFMCKLLLLGAASSLSRYGSAETKSFRIHCLVYIAILSPVAGIGFVPTGSSGEAVAHYLCFLAILLHWMVPFTACYSRTAERKFQPDGAFSFQGILFGTPSGALPFFLIAIALATVFSAIGLTSARAVFDWWDLLQVTLWAMGFLILVWSICMLASSAGKNLTGARGTAMTLLLCVLLLPIPLFEAISTGQNSDEVWRLHPMFAAFADIGSGGYSGLVMAAIGIAVSFVARWNDSVRQKRQEFVA